MGKTYAELVGFFLVIAGLFALVIAAAMVSTALAVATAGLILLFAGASAVYLANVVGAGKDTPR